MSILRKNPFTGEWTLCAENRKNRPYEFIHKTEVKVDNSHTCPFCGGHEQWTTEAVYQDGKNESWQIRVFPNMFPAVSETEMKPLEEGFYEEKPGFGRHEVLVDTPHHEVTIDQFSAEQLSKILSVLQERYVKIAEKEETAYVQIFKNCGASAGMSIRHSHWQLMGLPLVPKRILDMTQKMQGADCLLCNMLAYEKERGTRLALETEAFLAVTPYASRFPYELWVCPKVHYQNFGALSKAELYHLAVVLERIIKAVITLKKDVGYNICLIDGPKGEDFHWHLEIIPRIGGFAGFEYATNSYINPVLPETAAIFYHNFFAEKKETL